MALIRPSLTLVLDLDERLAQRETELELKRCFAYVGAPIVRKHAPANSDDPLSNTALAMVKFGQRKYLHSSDEGADELWDSVVEHWIGNILHKVGSTMKAYNRRQRLIGLPEVIFDKFDFELQGGEFVVSLHPDLLGFVPEELNAAFSMARELLNDGTFKDAVRVRIPADESYEEQQAAAWETWQEEHPEEAAGEAIATDENDTAGEAAAADGEAAAAADDTTTAATAATTAATTAAVATPSPSEEPELNYDDPAWLEYDRQRKSYENTAVPVTDSDELPPIQREELVEPPEPFSFEVDYSVWDVTFADGSTRRYDSSALAFVE